jgi:pyruvate/2-oxoglutarate dehydrogenase complex dihydrolipoamide acyltransferase (E2) component
MNPNTVPVRGIQRAMAKAMTAAAAVPHLGFSDEINLNALVELRRQLLPGTALLFFAL